MTNFLHADWQADDLNAATGEDACGTPETASKPVDPACEQPWGLTWRAVGVHGLAGGGPAEEAERARRRYHTTLSVAALLHLEVVVDAVLDEGIPGDFIETGVFRGGACIFLRGLLAARGVEDRRVFVADSFRGIPEPRRRVELAEGKTCDPDVEPTADWTDRYVSGKDAVAYNFRRYGLLDRRVVFVEGFFNESLPPLLGSVNAVRPVEAPDDAPVLALLRIDCDAHDGVLDALEAGYPRVAPGGFVIIDDWHLGGARAAVHAFRRRFGISAPLFPLPSDLVQTCAPDLGPLAACAAEGRVVRRHKALTMLVLPNGAYWRKPLLG